jgi:preprotein translocase subunit YajC
MFNRLSSKVFFGLVLAAALTVAALAQNGSNQKVEFYLDGKVGTEVVKKGAYKVSIPEAEQGTIEIKVGKKTVTAQFVKRALPNESDKDKMTYVENADGSRSVASITPRGRKYTLVLQENGGSVASGK